MGWSEFKHCARELYEGALKWHCNRLTNVRIKSAAQLIDFPLFRFFICNDLQLAKLNVSITEFNFNVKNYNDRIRTNSCAKTLCLKLNIGIGATARVHGIPSKSILYFDLLIFEDQMENATQQYHWQLIDLHCINCVTLKKPFEWTINVLHIQSHILSWWEQTIFISNQSIFRGLHELCSFLCFYHVN